MEGRSASVGQRNLENAGPDLEAMEAEKRVWKMTRSQRLACGGFSVKAAWIRGRRADGSGRGPEVNARLSGVNFKLRWETLKSPE